MNVAGVLSAVEATCARLVEDTFARIFPSALDAAVVGRRLIAVMQATPSDAYVVRVHPDDYARFVGDREYLEGRWSALLADAWPAERGTETPRAYLVEDPHVVLGAAAVEAVLDERPQTLALERADGERVAIGDGMTLGRADDNDVVVRDARASRHHARIAAEADGLAVVDLGSANGTWLDGKRIARARLVPGTTLTLGDSHLRVVAG